MMLETGWLAGHPDVGELLCFADRGMPAEEHEQVAAHLNECEHCQRELAAVEREVRTVSAALRVLPAATNDIRRAGALQAVRLAARKHERARRMRAVVIPRAAAAVLVVMGGLVAAGPGLAYMRSLFGGSAPVATVAPIVVSTPAAELRVVEVGIPWNRGDFTISFENIVPGTLAISQHDSSLATVQVTGGEGSRIASHPTSGVAISGLSGENPAISLKIPSGVLRVLIRVPGGKVMAVGTADPMLFDLNDLARGVVIRK